jgi:hypothetical protein
MAGSAVGESVIARWSSRGRLVAVGIGIGIFGLLMLAYGIDMGRRHDGVSALLGTFAAVVDFGLLGILVLAAQRMVTVLTSSAIYLGRGPTRRIPLDTVEAVAVVHTGRGWAIWLWPAGASAVRLLVPDNQVFRWKAQSLGRPTPDYWAKVAASRIGRAAQVIYDQAAAQPGSRVAAGAPIAELLRRGPDAISRPGVRYWSPSNEHAPTI